MVNIDTVYQTVLALANKEQRGYITPQEFNLFANHAQNDIFEQYFYDLNQFKRAPGNSSNYADITKIIESKINIFTSKYSANPIGGVAQPNDFYRISQASMDGVDCEYVTRSQQAYYDSPLTSPTKTRPIFYDFDGNFTFRPDGQLVTISYIRKPKTPKWSYVVVNEKPLWNPSNATHFELHPSEEKNLIVKILKLAGISIEDPGVVTVASQEEVKDIQQEKA
tara:strand:- start:1911 stop:2579 length:669 start_codon:yes stop_codon:yes gene_type:complete